MTVQTPLRRVADFQFVNSFTQRLVPEPSSRGEPLKRPSAPIPASHVPRQVKGAHFSFVEPDRCPDPVLISVSKPAAELLGLDLNAVLADPKESGEFLGLVSGNKVPQNTNPWSMCYGGHQFGSWAGQLGDGRAISIGEVVNARGERWEMQLKGAGLTPYSRFADGYAVLRSSIREYLCSEAMYHLGCPTTRALALVGSSRPVRRETIEKGAIVTRMAPSWVRFGNFEIFFSRGDEENLRKLADFVIETHFPEIANDEHKYANWLAAVVSRTAKTVATWQANGFCHGVLNTDNMSILGLTLDYGPFQFLDVYDPNYVCNHSDHEGRYAFNSQPGIGLWNLARLASAVSPLFAEAGNNTQVQHVLTELVEKYGPILEKEYSAIMRLKLGLQTSKDDDLDTLVYPLLGKLADARADYTQFWRSLSFDFRLSDPSHPRPHAAHLQEWYTLYTDRLTSELDASTDLAQADKERHQKMKRVNPKYILRNHLAQEVIDQAEKGDYSGVNDLLKVLQRPFEDGTPDEEARWAGPVPSWARGLKCSCSS